MHFVIGLGAGLFWAALIFFGIRAQVRGDKRPPALDKLLELARDKPLVPWLGLAVGGCTWLGGAYIHQSAVQEMAGLLGPGIMVAVVGGLISGLFGAVALGD